MRRNYARRYQGYFGAVNPMERSVDAEERAGNREGQPTGHEAGVASCVAQPSNREAHAVNREEDL